MLLEKRSKSSKVINEINVVPYVDIMLVLLVIFMVVAPLAVQGLDINLPNAPAEEIELDNSQPFVIDVTENGKYFIEEDGANVQVSLGFIEDRFSKIIKMSKSDGSVGLETVKKFKLYGNPNWGSLYEAFEMSEIFIEFPCIMG